MEAKIYPVYILSRVVREMYELCQKAVPNEGMGKILGYRCKWNETEYVKIVDWSIGTITNSHVHAEFTREGVRECEIFLDERYGAGLGRPIEVGVFHSHPFNSDPHFSQVDYNTFLSFPYNKEGNVFILIDPLANYFKTFQIQTTKNGPCLEQVRWIMYEPKIST